jgi:hypothetical protein
MNVFHRRHDGLWTHQISVVAGTLLPKSKGRDAGSLPNRESIEEGIARGRQSVFDPSRELSLEIPEKVGDPRTASARADQQMNMLGHQHVGQEQEFVSITRTLEILAEPPAPEFVGKQWLPYQAGESQFVDVPLCFEVLDSLPM